MFETIFFYGLWVMLGGGLAAARDAAQALVLLGEEAPELS